MPVLIQCPNINISENIIKVMESMLEVKAKQSKWIYFLRQLMVCSGVWTTFFMVGQFLGAPTVFVPQIRRVSAEILDDDLASWLYSVFGIAAAPWVLFLSALTKIYGFRIPHIIGCIDLFIAYIVFYLSTSPLQILVSDIVLGIGYASVLTNGIVIISEYASPEYRGIFLTIKSASLFWGIWSANAIGTFFHWKIIAYSGFLCSVYTITFVFWPESPQWLASKGRFDECKKSYYWLRGHDEKSEQEIEELIASQAGKSSRLNNYWSNISTAINTVKSREFYAPLLLICLLVSQYHFTGKMVCSIYAIDILKKITSSEYTAYMGMLILDGVTLGSMYFGCFLTKILYRRTLYLASSFTGVAFLFIISLYLYLVNLTVIAESKELSIVLLTCFSIAMGCGPMIMSTSIYAELMPLRFKNAMVLIAAILFYIYWTILLKVAPYLFKSFGMHGSFLFYGITAGILTVLLYKYLPETKDKTLQEIEQNFTTYCKSSFEMERFKNIVNMD